MTACTAAPLLCLLLTAVMAAGSLGAEQSRLLRRASALSGRQFSQSLLFQTPAASALDCARHCLTSSTRCVTVTHSVTAGRCRAHAAFVTSQSPGEPLPDTETYLAVDWLEADCESSSECPAENAECFAGRCVCAPGYFYSLGTSRCMDSCGADDLQRRMVQYPNFDTEGGDIAWDHLVTSASDCVNRCADLPACLTLTFHLPAGPCFLKNITALTSARGVLFISDRSYYQRTCA